MDRFIMQHRDQITGHLSCFDRVLFKGHLPISYAEGLDLGGQFVIQLIGVGAVLLWTVGGSYVIVKVVQGVAGLRISEDAEVQGIDLRTHGERGYNM